METQKVILITGASSGIGYATALAFAARGWNVIATARRTNRLAELENAVSALPSPHGDILTLAADVQSASDMQQAVAQGVAYFGRLDALVANAGLGQRGGLVESSWDDIDVVLRTNIDGVLHSIRAAVPAMHPTNGGHIVLISSVAGQLTIPYSATYGASKAFISSLARSLRLELENDHISVSDMVVGRTETEFNEKRRGAGKRTGGGIPTMTAEQVAAAIVRAVERKQTTVVLRPFDRLLLWANRLAPWLMARLARRQYK